MAVIQLFGREAARGGELRDLSERYRQAQFRRVGLESTLYAVAEAVGAIVRGRAPLVGRLEILDGTLTFGVLVAFMQYTQRFYLPIRDASAKFAVMQAATVAGERVFALLDTPVERRGRPGALQAAPAPAPARPAETLRLRPPALEFRDVWFAYPGAGQERHEADGAAADRDAGMGASRRVAPDRDRRAGRGGRRHRRREDDARPPARRGRTTCSAAPCWSKASTSGSGI